MQLQDCHLAYNSKLRSSLASNVLKAASVSVALREHRRASKAHPAWKKFRQISLKSLELSHRYSWLPVADVSHGHCILTFVQNVRLELGGSSADLPQSDRVHVEH